MAKMSWFKFWDEFLGDPKMLSLDDGMIVLWVKMLCLANRSEERGVIGPFPNKTALIKALYADEEQLDAALELFASDAYRMIDIREDGAIVLTNWEKRNPRKPSDEPRRAAERQRKARAQKTRDVTRMSRACHAPVTRDNDECHADVTRESRQQDIRDKSTDIDRQTARAREEWGAVVEAYFSWCGGTLGSLHAQTLGEYYDKLGAELVIKAFDIAKENDARKFSYVEKILAGWVHRGILTLADWERDEQQFQEAKQAKMKPRQAEPTGRYIPGVEESRKYLEEQERLKREIWGEAGAANG